MKPSIADGMVVAIHYTLKLDTGETVDSSEGLQPLSYLHGSGNIVEGLEDALLGKGVGDKFSVSVAPEDGYGTRNLEAIRQLPREAFPDDVEIAPGMRFAMESEDGQPVMFVVTALNDTRVTIDMNHPLAGQTLNFAIEVMDIRPATEEEIEHGHPHGPDGHDHDHGDDDDDHGHGHGHGHHHHGGGCSH